MNAESKRRRQQTEAHSEKNSPQTQNTSADHEARARDICEKCNICDRFVPRLRRKRTTSAAAVNRAH
jgi:hypothetical protein